RTLREHPVLRQVFEAHPAPIWPDETLPEAIRALDVGIVVVHLDRAMERIEEARDRAREKDPHDVYTLRLFNPEKGISRLDLERARSQLAESFGPPVWSDGDTEIYRAAPAGAPAGGDG